MLLVRDLAHVFDFTVNYSDEQTVSNFNAHVTPNSVMEKGKASEVIFLFVMCGFCFILFWSSLCSSGWPGTLCRPGNPGGCTTFVSAMKKHLSERKLRKGHRLFWLTVPGLTVHHGGECMEAGARGSCSHTICSQEAERDACLCPACSLSFLFSPRLPPTRWHHPHSEWYSLLS